jgi:hypothetical protein
MTTPHAPQPRTPGQDRQLYEAAREHARQAAAGLARHIAGGAQPEGAGPLDQVRAASELERAASIVSYESCRAAREAGYDWHQIGAALTGLPPSADPRISQQIAETAYSYANPRGTYAARAEQAPFTWTCRTCQEPIADYGPAGHPALDEHGHAPGCARLRHAIAARQPELEAGQ